MANNNSNKIVENMINFFKNITIEPILFLYYTGYYQLLNMDENFRLERFCRVDLDRREDCDTLGDGSDVDLEVAVQKLENQFLVYDPYISVALTVLLLIFIASWSDKHGRLVPMVMSLAGWILYCVVYLLTVLFHSWSAWTLLLAAFLRSMGGWHWVLLMASYAYIVDITTETNRTTRMTITMAAKGFGMSAGTALGPILYDFSGYALVYIVAIALFTICIIWSCLVIPHIPHKPQSGIQEVTVSKRIMKIPRKLKQNLYELVDTSIRERSGYSRFLVNYLIFMMLLEINAFPQKMFLWSRIVLKWDIDQYSIYAVSDQLMCNIVILLVTPLIKYSKFHDCITGSILELTLFCKTLAFGILTNPSKWYVLYVFTIVPQWIPSVCIRSLLSKVSSKHFTLAIFITHNI